MTTEKNVYLLSGNSTSRTCWANMISRLASTGHAIHPLDHAGHGADERTDKITIDAFAREIYESIKDQKGIILIGLSLGGHVFYRVANLLIENKKDLLKLFIVGSPPITKRISLPMYVPRPDANEYIMAALPLLCKETNYTDEEAITFVRCQLEKKDFETAETKAAIDAAKKVSVGRHLATSLFSSPVDELSFIEAVHKKCVTVCMAHATNDAAVSLAYLQQIDPTLLWKQKIVMVEGSHLLPLNNPDGFSDCLVEFINA